MDKKFDKCKTRSSYQNGIPFDNLKPFHSGVGCVLDIPMPCLKIKLEKSMLSSYLADFKDQAFISDPRRYTIIETFVMQ